jgi:hypothetical protein
VDGNCSSTSSGESRITIHDPLTTIHYPAVSPTFHKPAASRSRLSRSINQNESNDSNDLNDPNDSNESNESNDPNDPTDPTDPNDPNDPNDLEEALHETC